MPISHLFPLGRLAVPVVMSILLVGCGGKAEPKEPDVDQAAHTLQEHFYKLSFVTTLIEIRITDGIFDKYVACGNGKVKLTYAISGKATSYAATGSGISRRETKTVATPREIVDDVVRYLPEVGTFSVTERQSDGATVKVVNAKARTWLTLHSPGTDRLTLTGGTDCLRRLGKRTH